MRRGSPVATVLLGFLKGVYMGSIRELRNITLDLIRVLIF